MDTPRLHLTLMSPDHLDAFHRIWSNPEATQWSVRGICKTLDESKQWMSGILPQNNPDGLVYAVFTRQQEGSQGAEPSSEPQMIGIVGVHRPLPKAEVGYIFHPSVWGRGYATEALAAFLGLFWELRPSAVMVEAMTDAENYASQRVLTKCGFKEVSRLREEAVIATKGPEKRDVLVFEVQAPTT